VIGAAVRMAWSYWLDGWQGYLGFIRQGIRGGGWRGAGRREFAAAGRESVADEAVEGALEGALTACEVALDEGEGVPAGELGEGGGEGGGEAVGGGLGGEGFVDHLVFDDCAALQAPVGAGGFSEQHFIERAFGGALEFEVGQQALEAFLAFAEDEAGIGGEAMSEGVAGRVSFAVGADGAVRFGSVTTGCFFLLLGAHEDLSGRRIAQGV
jgi:hypothetical protein